MIPLGAILPAVIPRGRSPQVALGLGVAGGQRRALGEAPRGCTQLAERRPRQQEGEAEDNARNGGGGGPTE